MNGKLYTLFILAFMSVISLSAQTVVTITDADLVGGQTYNWTNDNTYVLDGPVFLEEGGRLNIEAGTVVRGMPNQGDVASALIITRGATIYAEGTADNPVIFTAEDDDINDPGDFTAEDRGEWGGLIILGRATVARPGGMDNIEGLTVEDRTAFGGGDNPDDEDNSGVLRYVSIRHGGAALAPGDEINGLTLGGVGSATEIDYVEVFANFDDGIEWFGGTVVMMPTTMTSVTVVKDSSGSHCKVLTIQLVVLVSTMVLTLTTRLHSLSLPFIMLLTLVQVMSSLLTAMLTTLHSCYVTMPVVSTTTLSSLSFQLLHWQ